MNIDQEKQDLRRIMRQRRIERPISPAENKALNEHLALQILAEPDLGRVGCVWPLPGEADLRAVCHLLFNAGRHVLLPETTPKGESLLFRRWRPDCEMMAGRFGTHHPDGDYDRPDLVLVPLLAFDRTFNRLGYGGGYYDRTLDALKCRAFGFALSWQEVASVPVGAHDEPLDRIVTEREIIRQQAGEGRAG